MLDLWECLTRLEEGTNWVRQMELNLLLRKDFYLIVDSRTTYKRLLILISLALHLYLWFLSISPSPIHYGDRTAQLEAFPPRGGADGLQQQKRNVFFTGFLEWVVKPDQLSLSFLFAQVTRVIHICTDLINWDIITFTELSYSDSLRKCLIHWIIFK